MTRKHIIIAVTIFITVTLLSVLTRDHSEFGSKASGTVYQATTCDRSCKIHRWARHEYRDTQHGLNGRTPNHNVIRAVHSEKFKVMAKRAWRRYVSAGQTAKFGCCHLPNPKDWYDGFISGMGDGVMCAMYQSQDRLQAAECAGATIGKGVYKVVVHPTKVLVTTTADCAKDAAKGALAAGAYTTAVIVKQKHFKYMEIGGELKKVFWSSWVWIVKHPKAVTKSLYTCWAAAYISYLWNN